MKKAILPLCLSLAFMSAASAEVVVGVTLSATGPGSSMGIPMANAVKILPKSIGRESIRYIVIDDASDPTTGSKASKKLIIEDKVDVLIGSTNIPVAIAQAAIAEEEKVPMVAIAPMALDPQKQPHIFAVPQPIPLMIEAAVEDMQKNGIQSLGFIGFADAWGDLAYNILSEKTGKAGIQLSSNERYARSDTSVTGQMLKITSAKPQAIFVGGSSTPAALPQISAADRGIQNRFYHTHGVVNKDFIRLGGKSVEGAIAPTGPVVVVEQLPDNHPLKKTGMEFIQQYETAYGPDSRNAFAAYTWDAAAIIQAAIPKALNQAKPGTPAFRSALRDAIENAGEVVGTHAVYHMTATDHHGVDQRARVLVQVQDGQWKLMD